MDTSLNARIVSRGRELFAAIAGEKPSLFDHTTWTGRVMEWCLANENFKVQLFRFVDVFPALATPRLLADHISDYFGTGEELPPVLARGARAVGRFGTLGGAALGKLVSANIREMARQFIVGETVAEVLGNLERLRKEGFGAVVDVLGEATLSEAEADAYAGAYLELLDALGRVRSGWHAFPGTGGDAGLDWGCAPQVNVAIKPSALYSLASPQDFEGSVNAILARLRPIAARVVEQGGFLCIDMESYRFKGITLELYRRLKREYRGYPHMGIALQSYLKDTDRDLEELLAWARRDDVPISVRLVKGAYWDYETVRAGQMGWESPVWGIKAETDAAFERQARLILENHAICHFACGSHNIRTIAAVLETAAAVRVPESRYEFQMLYGMAEPVRRGILRQAGRVRLYCPFGAMVPGMGYLVRRLLENTANESFLRRSFAEGTEVDRLLEDPLATIGRVRAGQDHGAPPAGGVSADQPAPFANEPAIDFTRSDQRAAFPREIAAARAHLGRDYPLFIGGRDVGTADLLPSINPARPSEVLGRVCQAGITETARAIEAARDAFPAWREVPPGERAAYLFRAARAFRERIFEFAAWQVLEIGKQWDQAHADVAEAIDFLEYYGREMIRLGEPRRLGRVPAELNQYLYEPRGPAAVIAPWNFPLAISMGMTSAAIVTGNPVVFKPSSLTPVIGRQLVEVFRSAGLPEGVFNYVPGRSSVMGDFLVDHPDIALIAFTGSMEVGLRIIERAARVHPGQRHVKRVIAEMGGKNA
ncbi:MAG TPA: proline dehydrogenase family protein, partial [Desulfuromonadaceae bacterium]